MAKRTVQPEKAERWKNSVRKKKPWKKKPQQLHSRLRSRLRRRKNVRLGDCIQIMSRPADKTAEARKKNKSSDP